MSKLAEHTIYDNRRNTPILNWVENAKYRYYPSVDIEKQLEYALKIARVEDSTARDMMLELLELVKRESDKVVKMKEEFITLHEALTTIEKSLE